MRRRRYTLEILQAEVERWTPKLIAKGYILPEIPITVYTSAVQFEAAQDNDPAEGSSVFGMAALSVNDFPIVYVKLPRSVRRDQHDPLTTLIHELLHHVTPKLNHTDIYELSEKFRADDTDSILPPTRDNELDVFEPEHEPTEAERRNAEVVSLEWLDELWLDANGFPSTKPARSRLTGRFIKRDPGLRRDW